MDDWQTLGLITGPAAWHNVLIRAHQQCQLSSMSDTHRSPPPYRRIRDSTAAAVRCCVSSVCPQLEEGEGGCTAASDVLQQLLLLGHTTTSEGDDAGGPQAKVGQLLACAVWEYVCIHRKLVVCMGFCVPHGALFTASRV